MSSAFPNRRLNPRDGYDIVFCHSCGHEWYRHADDASPPPSCQRCGEDIVEIVTRENDPREYQQNADSMIPDPLFNLGLLGSAGPSQRMPPSQLNHGHGSGRLHDHFHDHGNFHDHGHFHSHDHFHDHDHDHDHDRDHDHDDHDMADGDEFDHNFHTRLHQQFHNQIHARAHAEAVGELLHAHDHGSAHNHGSGHEDRGNHTDSDPEEADIEEHEFHGPNNLFMYRTVTTNFSSSDRQQPPSSNSGEQARTGANRRPGTTDPSDAESMFSTFTNFLHGFRDNQAGRSGPESLFFNSGQPGGFGAARQTTSGNGPTNVGATRFTIATGPLFPGQTGAAADFNTIFSNIMGNVGPPDIEEQNPRAAGGLPPGFPTVLHQILLAILSRDGNFQHGDAVHSDEAFDRIVTMLMEQNQQSSGPPPASQSALDELEKKKVDAGMLGSDGHAECTICISEVELNEEVVFLPCKHWFHEECVVMWLKQHNTCPVCRNPVVSRNAENTNQPSNSAAGSGAASSGTRGDGTGGNTGGSSASGGAAANNNSGGSGIRGGGTSLFGSALNNLSLPRGIIVNITGPTTLHGQGWGTTGVTDPEPGRSSSTTGNPATSTSGTSTSSSPNPHTPTLRQRAQHQERLNAIRSAAGLPPAAPSASTSANTTTNPYRSPRVSERSEAAERERRRRDSHSPNPGHNIPRRRYSPRPQTLDEHVATTPSLSESQGPSSRTSSSHRSWGVQDANHAGAYPRGSEGNPSSANANPTRVPSLRHSTARHTEQGSWSRSRSSFPRHASARDDGSSSGMSGRPYASPWRANSHTAYFGGDGHDDSHDELHSDASGYGQDAGNDTTGTGTSTSTSNNGSTGDSTNSSGGGSGGLFGFFRRR